MAAEGQSVKFSSVQNIHVLHVTSKKKKKQPEVPKTELNAGLMNSKSLIY